MLTRKWRKSSESNADCVEVRAVDDAVEVRHSKDPDGPVLRYSRAEWDAFLRGAKNGEFDIA